MGQAALQLDFAHCSPLLMTEVPPPDHCDGRQRGADRIPDEPATNGGHRPHATAEP